jgi:protein-S-isoprenylcysteine O-methyltransferase Ste14
MSVADEIESESEASGGTTEHGFLPASPARHEAESVFVRLIATAGVVGIGTLLGALLTANNVAGWIVGLVVSLVSVVIAAVLWRSRTL